MATTRTIKGTINNLATSTGTTEITYLGPTKYGIPGDLIRAFRVTPTNTGDLTVNITKSYGLLDIQIFNENAYTTWSAPSTGQPKYFNVIKAGKDKGTVGIAATNGTNYVVMLKFDTYANASYVGNVNLP